MRPASSCFLSKSSFSSSRKTWSFVNEGVRIETGLEGEGVDDGRVGDPPSCSSIPLWSTTGSAIGDAVSASGPAGATPDGWSVPAVFACATHHYMPMYMKVARNGRVDW